MIELIQCCDGIWAIDEGWVRSFLVVGRERALLVDTGSGEADVMELVRSVTDLPVTLIHSHADGDHTGGDGPFDQVTLHRAELESYREKRPDETVKYTFVEDGEVLDLGGRQLEVVHLPGHTPGHIVLLDRANRLVLGGDMVQLGAAVFLFGVWRNVPQYVDSLVALRARAEAGEFDRVLSCHGETTLPAAFLDELIEGARRLRDGLLSPEPEETGRPAALYRWGRTQFLYRAPD